MTWMQSVRDGGMFQSRRRRRGNHMSGLWVGIAWIGFGFSGIVIHSDVIWLAGLVSGNIWFAAHWLRGAQQHRENQHD